MTTENYFQKMPNMMIRYICYFLKIDDVRNLRKAMKKPKIFGNFLLDASDLVIYRQDNLEAFRIREHINFEKILEYNCFRILSYWLQTNDIREFVVELCTNMCSYSQNCIEFIKKYDLYTVYGHMVLRAACYNEKREIVKHILSKLNKVPEFLLTIFSEYETKYHVKKKFLIDWFNGENISINKSESGNDDYCSAHDSDLFYVFYDCICTKCPKCYGNFSAHDCCCDSDSDSTC